MDHPRARHLCPAQPRRNQCQANGDCPPAQSHGVIRPANLNDPGPSCFPQKPLPRLQPKPTVCSCFHLLTQTWPSSHGPCRASQISFLGETVSDSERVLQWHWPLCVVTQSPLEIKPRAQNLDPGPTPASSRVPIPAIQSGSSPSAAPPLSGWLTLYL